MVKKLPVKRSPDSTSSLLARLREAVDRYKEHLSLLTIVLTVALLYGHTLHVPWYMDDRPAIVDNPLIRDLTHLPELLWGRRGIAFLSFALNYHFGGVEVSGYHLVNIALHLITSILVFFVLMRLQRGRWLIPLLGALVFAAHPIQTQAVTYVVQRMTGLAGLWFFLALYCYLRAREELAAGAQFFSRRHIPVYLVAVVAGLLAVLSKENSAILPGCLFLCSYFFPCVHEQRGRRLFLYLLPFSLPLLILVLATLLPLLDQSTLRLFTNTDNLRSLQGNSPLRYLVTEFSVICLYIRLLVIPYGQALDHGYPIVAQVLSLKNGLALATILALGLLAWWLRRRQPFIACGISWFFLGLAVESSVIPLDPLFEHRLYLSMFGFVLVVLGLGELIPSRPAFVSLLVTFTLALSVVTWQRNLLWNDPVLFFEDNLRVAPHNERVYVSLAEAYRNVGRTREAEVFLQRALSMNPDYAEAYLSLAGAYAAQHREGDSESLLRLAMDRADGHRAGFYTAQADYYLANGRRDEALVALERGLTKLPGAPELHIALGYLLLGKGDYPAAGARFAAALALDPQSVEGCAGLGATEALLGHWREAELYNRRAIAGRFFNPTPHYNLGLANYNAGRLPEALAEFTTAIKQKPDYADAIYNAAVVAIELGEGTIAGQMVDALSGYRPVEATRLKESLAKSLAGR